LWSGSIHGFLTSLSEQVPGFLNGQSATSLARSFLLAIIVGLSLSEMVGCWAALRLGGLKYACTTAAWLAVLFIPGWLLYMVLSLLLVSFLNAILLLAGVPLIARLFTNDPRFPRICASFRALSQKEDEDMKSLFLIYIYAAISKIGWIKEICPNYIIPIDILELSFANHRHRFIPF